MKQGAATPFQRARLSKGLTLLELAERCTALGEPVSEGQMSRIDRGLAVPRPGLRAVLAEELGIDVVDDFEASA